MKTAVTVSVAIGIFTILLAGVVYWITSSHYQDIMKGYQEILREKDINHWEIVNRRETHSLNSAEQCKKQFEYCTAFITACEDQLKSLLNTDVQSVKMREKSHREILAIVQTQAEIKSQPNPSLCLHYNQLLQNELSACNTSQVGLRLKTRQHKEREKKLKNLMYSTQEQFKQCESDKEQYVSYSYTHWATALSVIIVATVCIVATKSRGVLSNQQLANSMQNQQTENKKVEELTALSREKEKLSESLADQQETSKMEADQLRDELAATKTELATACTDLQKEGEARMKLEESLSEKKKQITKLSDEKETLKKQHKNALKLDAELARQLEQQQQKMAAQISQLEEAKLRLVNEIKNLKKELQDSHCCAVNKDKEIWDQKQSKEALEKHVKYLDTKIERQHKENRQNKEKNESMRTHVTTQDKRISKQNQQLLRSQDEIKQKDEQITKLQLELLKKLDALKKMEKEMETSQEKHIAFTKDFAEFEAAVLQKDIQLESEIDRRRRMLREKSCLEDKVKKLERKMGQKSSKTSHKMPREEIDIEQIRLDLHHEFEVDYNRSETRTHGQLTLLTEQVGQLKADKREQSIELTKLQTQIKTLQELLNQGHAREKREKREETQERTYRVKLDLSLHPNYTQ
ncbi:trichohyalin-like [Halichondria panicea]|uniref:trichohyalin-like n=1 Tax=Halichondria panicea TaxID=6063 RepID=UPI00312B37D9